MPVILAAGASSRMGRPKEFLELLPGVTCLDRVLDACRQAGCDTPVVVTRAERAEAVREHLAARQVSARVAVNPTPELGQTSSLRVGLSALPGDTRAFLIYPVDYPLVEAADVAQLCAAFVEAASPGGGAFRDEAAAPALVVAPSFQGRRGHPVIAAHALAADLLALAQGDSARAVLYRPEVATRYVTFSDDRVLQDMDTPAAYQLCRARLERVRPDTT